MLPTSNKETLFKVDVYCCRIRLCILGDPAGWERRCRVLGACVDTLRTSEGFTQGIGNDEWVFVLKHKYISHNLIGHELKHLVDYIIEAKGVTCDESKGWLAGFLNDKLYRLIVRSGRFCANTNKPK